MAASQFDNEEQYHRFVVNGMYGILYNDCSHFNSTDFYSNRNQIEELVRAADGIACAFPRCVLCDSATTPRVIFLATAQFYHSILSQYNNHSLGTCHIAAVLEWIDATHDL
jgi:hypothetical protein